MYQLQDGEYSQESSIHAPSTSRGCTNAGGSFVTARKPPRRSKSANFPRATVSSRSGHALLKNHPAKHSTIAVVKARTRPNTLLRPFVEETPGNISLASGSANHETIDRILFRNIAGNVTQMQTIVPLSTSATNEARGESDSSAMQQQTNSKEEARGTWLRSSMRRLRHFRLPSTTNDETSEVSASGSTAETEDTSQIVPATSNASVPSSDRPVSAPSRLPDCSGQRETIVESRNLVSNVPSGRARSNSTSSRTRRHTSLSSSESSLASSVGTSPTCSPSPTAVRSNQEQVPVNSNNNNARM